MTEPLVPAASPPATSPNHPAPLPPAELLALLPPTFPTPLTYRRAALAAWSLAHLRCTPLAGSFDTNYPIEARGKRPLLGGWPNAPHTPICDILNRYPVYTDRESGWVLDPHHLVIDVDPRNFPESDDPFARLCHDLAIDPSTLSPLVVRTGSGGSHIYLTKPPGMAVTNELHAYPGVEFKSAGRQVVMPGSRHASGNFYHFLPLSPETPALDPSTPSPLPYAPQITKALNYLNTLTSPQNNATEQQKYRQAITLLTTLLSYIPPAPESLLQAIHYIPSSDSLEISPGHSYSMIELAQSGLVDKESAIQNVIARLQSYPPAIEGSNGDATTYKAAALCRDYGLSAEMALLLIEKHYNPRCVPPWPPSELRTKIDNAYAYAKAQPANALPEVQFDHVPLPDLPPSADPVAHLTPRRKRDADALPHTHSPFTSSSRSSPGDPNQLDDLSEWRNHLRLQKGGAPIDNDFYNIALYLLYHPDLQGMVGYNQFTYSTSIMKPTPWHHDVMTPEQIACYPYRSAQWSDMDDTHLRLWFNRDITPFDAATATIRQAVNVVASYRRYHPVRHWLSSLEWDGTHRLNAWLTTCFHIPPTQYTAAVGRKFLMAAVSRVLYPGYKFDFMPIFEGRQGQRKSTAMQILANGWFTDSMPDLNSRDAVEQMRGSLIIEFSELDALNRHEASTLKAFISRQTDKARLAYASRAEEYPRQCVFVGTTNQSHYLKDETGNRRYWPLTIPHDHMIDTDLLASIRDQLWAEALWRVQHMPEPLYMAKHEEAQEAQQLQAAKRDYDEWEQVILDYLLTDDPITGMKPVHLGTPPSDRSETPHDQPYHPLTTTYFWEQAFHRSAATLTRPDQLRIGRVLTALDFVSKVTRVDNRTVRAWVPPKTPLTASEAPAPDHIPYTEENQEIIRNRLKDLPAATEPKLELTPQQIRRLEQEIFE